MPPSTKSKRASEAPVGDEPDEKRVKMEPVSPARRSQRTGNTPTKPKTGGPAIDITSSVPLIDPKRIMHPDAVKLFAEVQVCSKFLLRRVVF